MKDVSELLVKRLQRLEGTFSRDWIADFSSLIEFIQTNEFSVSELATERRKSLTTSD
jgi:hypothetical protein